MWPGGQPGRQPGRQAASLYVYTYIYIYIHTLCIIYIYIYIYKHAYIHKVIAIPTINMFSAVLSCLHPIPITTFRSFRTQPLENLSAAVKLPIKNMCLGNPPLGTNIVRENIVMGTGCMCHILPRHGLVALQGDRPLHDWQKEAIGKGQMGSTLTGSQQISYFLTDSFPNQANNITFAAAPLALTPFHLSTAKAKIGLSPPWSFLSLSSARQA